MSLQNEIAKMSNALSLNVSTTENEIMKKLRKYIRVGVSSIKDNLAKLNEELIDYDELQEKMDGLTNQFHIKYDDFKQKINETEEGITNLQTELETTGDEVKTNTAERIRIAELLRTVKRDLNILTSFKCFVSIIKPFTLDLRRSNFGALIGFEPTVIRQTQYGTDIPNITNSLDTLYIHCDLVDNSIVDGEYGDVIYTISTADLRRSYPSKDEPILKEFCEVNKTIINSIRIYITDALGKIINLNKVDKSFTYLY